jgi:hypothetical protein
MAGVTLSDNSAANGGAVQVASGGVADIDKTKFVLNSTTSVGGGAIINMGTLTLAKSELVSNYGPINGGAVNTQPGATTTIVRTTFRQNRSGSLGGALSNLGTLTIKRSKLIGNTGSSGGAIATGNDQITLDRVEIEGNFPDNCSPLNTLTGCTD